MDAGLAVRSANLAMYGEVLDHGLISGMLLKISRDDHAIAKTAARDGVSKNLLKLCVVGLKAKHETTIGVGSWKIAGSVFVIGKCIRKRKKFVVRIAFTHQKRYGDLIVRDQLYSYFAGMTGNLIFLDCSLEDISSGGIDKICFGSRNKRNLQRNKKQESKAAHFG